MESKRDAFVTTLTNTYAREAHELESTRVAVPPSKLHVARVVIALNGWDLIWLSFAALIGLVLVFTLPN